MFLQIAESGLPLHAFDKFEDAAKKVISLAGGNLLGRGIEC